jgi:hypothetical protein
MKIFSPVLKGTTTVSDGTTNLSGSFTGSLSGTATTASYVDSSQTDTTQNTRLNTIEAVTGSYASTSSLAASNTRITTLEAVTGSYATTGSNTFYGTQIFTGSLYVTSDLIVQGSSSLQNITASAVSIGTNTVILNTDSPILRFGGVSVQDSGSANGRSGSLFWDSVHDHWIYVVPSGSAEGYNSAMLMNGPKNTGSLGNEIGLTSGYVPRSQGEDHLEDSNIYSSGTVVGIGTTNPSSIYMLTLAGDSSSRVGGIVFRQSSTDTFYIGNPSVTNTTDFELWNPRNGYIRLATNNIERVRINSSGSVGIGITNPSALLHIYSSDQNMASDAATSYTYAKFRLEPFNTSTVGISMGLISPNVNYIQTSYSNGSSAPLVINPYGGNVGIGTTSPGYRLDVNGAANFASSITATALSLSNTDGYLGTINSTGANGGYFAFQTSGTTIADIGTATQIFGSGGTTTFGLNARGSRDLAFGSNQTERMRITSGGNVGIGLTSPGASLHIIKALGNDAIAIGETGTNQRLKIGQETSYTGNYINSTNIDLKLMTYADGGSGGTIMFYTSTNTSLNERMRITTGGQVLIGQTTASGNSNGIYFRPGIESGFIVTSDVALQLSRLGTTGNIQTFYSGTTRVGKIAVGSSTITFESENNGGITVNSAGNVGVGTSTPTHNLHVNSSLRVNRTVYSWYKASWQGNGTYWHMKTNLYAGAAGNSQFTMSLFKAYMYAYSSAAVYEGAFGFHNWNGILYSAASAGNIGFGGYISSDGYVVLVILSGSGETGVQIDWHQTYADYAFRESTVTAAGLHGSTTGKY